MSAGRKALKPVRCFDIAIFFLKLTGVWHFEGVLHLPYAVYGHVMFVFLAVIPTLAMIIFVAKVWGDLIQMAEGLYFTSTMLALVFKFALKSNLKMKNVVEELNSERLTRQKIDQDKYVEEAMKITNRNIILVTGTFSMVCCSWGIAPFFNDTFASKELPKMGWYYIDTSVSPNYEIIYCYQIFGIWLGALMNGSLDTLIAGLMTHAGGQLEVLKHSLKHIRRRARERLGTLDDLCGCTNKYICNKRIHLEENNRPLDQELYAEIMDCITHHQAITDFVSNIESTFTASIFAQFSASILVICITGFELSVMKPFTAQFFSIVMYQLSIIVQLFLYCYYGNEIALKSSAIGEAVYMSEWYRFGTEVNRALWIIMERSKRPMKLTAVKLFALSLDTFTSILKSAYSFYAVLRQMNADVEIDVNKYA